MDWLNLLFRGPAMSAEVDGLRAACRNAALRHADEVKDFSRRLEDVEGMLAELSLMNQTLLRLLIAKKAFTREHFQAVCRDLDLLDGVKDGKLRPKPPPGAPPRPAPPKARGPAPTSKRGTKRIRKVRSTRRSR